MQYNNKRYRRFLLVAGGIRDGATMHVMLTEIDVLVRMKQLSKSV